MPVPGKTGDIPVPPAHPAASYRKTSPWPTPANLPEAENMPSAKHPRVRVAVVQAAPVFLDIDATVDKCISLIQQAAREDAQLIAFPETFIPGYPWFIWLDSPAWCMQFIQRYHDNSLKIGDVEYQRVAAAARAARIHVALGFSERAGGSLYMGQALIDPTGATVFTRRKLKPTHVERYIFGEGAGNDLLVADTTCGRIGALCCWEHLQPLSKYALYAQDEQIHIAAWPSFSLYRGAAFALGPEMNMALSQVYAAEGQCFVLAPCATVSDNMVALMCTDDTKRQLLKAGGGFARIFGPDGSPVGSPLAEDAEGLLVADLDLGLIPLAKGAADPAGHYSRPDVTRLLINRSPALRVVEQRLPTFEEPAQFVAISAEERPGVARTET
jgi:aliphatic nitrilase